MSSVFQQFKGPMSELAHAVTKLVILKQDRPASGGGAASQIGKNVLAATGVDSLVGNVKSAFSDEEKFEVQINPEKYDLAFSIEYESVPAQAQQAPTQHFKRIAGQDLVVAFTLDGTGVVPASASDLTALGVQNLYKVAGATDVSYVTNRIKALKKIVYDFRPDTHEPNPVMIVWGDVQPFKGRLEKMEVSYTLFHPSGIPIRAELKLTFKESVPTGTDNTNSPSLGLPESPDLTHRRTVKQSDTLLLMTEDVYGDPSYYWQVARENRLTHFRKLKVRSDIYLPPLDRSTTI